MEKPTLSCIFFENHLFIMMKFTSIHQIITKKKLKISKISWIPFQKKWGIKFWKLLGQKKIKNTNEYFSNNRKIVLFDDAINAPEKIQNKIANHWTDGRHHGISPIYLSQSYYDTPKKLRLNCSNMILYPPTTKKHKNLIAKENLIDTRAFDELKPFEFLFLDKKRDLF